MRWNLNAVLAAVCLILAVALPTLVAWYLATASAAELANKVGFGISPAFELSVAQRGVVIVMGLLPVTCMAVALTYARRSFRSFQRNEYFTLDVVRGLKGFAAAIFFSGLSGLVVAPLASLLLSDRRSLVLNVDSSQVLLLVFAGIVWQIAAVMTKAVALAEENSQFV